MHLPTTILAALITIVIASQKIPWCPTCGVNDHGQLRGGTGPMPILPKDLHSAADHVKRDDFVGNKVIVNLAEEESRAASMAAIKEKFSPHGSSHDPRSPAAPEPVAVLEIVVATESIAATQTVVAIERVKRFEYLDDIAEVVDTSKATGVPPKLPNFSRSMPFPSPRIWVRSESLAATETVAATETAAVSKAVAAPERVSAIERVKRSSEEDARVFIDTTRATTTPKLILDFPRYRPFHGPRFPAFEAETATTTATAIETAAVIQTIVAPERVVAIERVKRTDEEESNPVIGLLSRKTELGYTPTGVPTITPTWTARYRPFHGPIKRPANPTAVTMVKVPIEDEAAVVTASAFQA